MHDSHAGDEIIGTGVLVSVAEVDVIAFSLGVVLDQVQKKLSGRCGNESKSALASLAQAPVCDNSFS